MRIGYRHSEETKEKIRKAHLGKKAPWSGRYKHKPLSEEHKKHIGMALVGRKVSSETRDKIRKSLIGHPVSEETKKKMSENGKGKLNGEKHWNWQGGLSFEPYTVDWTETLKRSIRERDHYICRLCGKPQGETAHDVHHIDYNKKNCDPNNLVTLCSICHQKTNFNRKKWENFNWNGKENLCH